MCNAFEFVTITSACGGQHGAMAPSSAKKVRDNERVTTKRQAIRLLPFPDASGFEVIRSRTGHPLPLSSKLLDRVPLHPLHPWVVEASCYARGDDKSVGPQAGPQLGRPSRPTTRVPSTRLSPTSTAVEILAGMRTRVVADCGR